MLLNSLDAGFMWEYLEQRLKHVIAAGDSHGIDVFPKVAISRLSHTMIADGRVLFASCAIEFACGDSCRVLTAIIAQCA